MKLVKRSNVLLIVVTLTLFFACKKDKINIIEPEIDPGKPAETMPDDILLRKAISYNKFRDGVNGPLLTDTLFYNENDQLIKLEHIGLSSRNTYTFSYNENGSLSTVLSRTTLAEGYKTTYSLTYDKGLLDSITIVSDLAVDTSYCIISLTRNNQGQVTTVMSNYYPKLDSAYSSAQFDFLWVSSGNLASMQGRTYNYAGYADFQRATFPSISDNTANIGLSRLPAGYLFILALRENPSLTFVGDIESSLFTTYLFTSGKNVFNNGTGRRFQHLTGSDKEDVNYIEYTSKAMFDLNGILKTYTYFEENTFPAWGLVGTEFFYEPKK